MKIARWIILARSKLLTVLVVAQLLLVGQAMAAVELGMHMDFKLSDGSTGYLSLYSKQRWPRSALLPLMITWTSKFFCSQMPSRPLIDQ